jgi:hypothetical protein
MKIKIKLAGTKGKARFTDEESQRDGVEILLRVRVTPLP